MKSATDELVVFFMRAYPRPHNGSGFDVGDGAIMIADARRIKRFMSCQFLEAKGRMTWIFQPKFVILVCQTLNRFRQALVTLPEFRRRPGGHKLLFGHSFNVLFWRAVFASLTKNSSFPLAASSSIWWSQFSLSRCKIHRASRVKSGADSLSMARSISTTVLMERI